MQTNWDWKTLHRAKCFPFVWQLDFIVEALCLLLVKPDSTLCKQRFPNKTHKTICSMCMHEANLFIITIIFNDRITNKFSDIFVGENVNDSCGTGLVYAPPPLLKKENLTIDKTLTKPKKKSNIINQSLKKNTTQQFQKITKQTNVTKLKRWLGNSNQWESVDSLTITAGDLRLCLVSRRS